MRADGLVLAGGAVLVWALALYVASRAPLHRRPVLAALAMLCLTAYLAGEALGAIAPDEERRLAWLRWTWWGQSIAAPVWVMLVLTLAIDEASELLAARLKPWFWPVGAVAIGIGAIFSVLALPAVPSDGLLQAYQVFVMACIVGGAIGLMLLTRQSQRGTPVRSRFVGLFISAIAFVLGGGWLVIASGVYGLNGLPGQILLIAGMANVGWNIARYGALLASEEVGGDSVAFAATMLAIVAVYGSLALLLAPDPVWLERALPLLLLVMTTHVVVDTRGHLLDRIVYVPLLSTLRGQLRDLANRVVRQPDELTALADVRETVDQILRERATETSEPSEMRVLVEGALRHLNDLPALSRHPLLGQLGAHAGSPLEQAAALRNQLDLAIERLRPSGARPSPGSANVGGWLHYLVLKEAYVDGRPNKQIMQRYTLSEGTFHRARRRAVDAVAADLAQSAPQAAVAEG
jgi:hypothetical protein